MDAAAIVLVAGLVAGMVQVIKAFGLRRDLALALVVVLSAAATALWAWSAGAYSQENAFSIVAGFVAVTTGAIGVYEGVREVKHLASGDFRL